MDYEILFHPHPTSRHIQMHYPVATMVKVSEDKTFLF